MPRPFPQLAASFLLCLGTIACSNQPSVKIFYKKKSGSKEQSLSQSPFAADGRRVFEGDLPAESSSVTSKDEAKKETKVGTSSVTIATEPTPVGGAYLVCLESRSETSAYALCRFENEKEEKIACPANWDISFYASENEMKTLLTLETVEGEEFSWRVRLDTFSLERLKLEIYDREKELSMVMAPLAIDPATGRPSEASDPRKNRGQEPPPGQTVSALRSSGKASR